MSYDRLDAACDFWIGGWRAIEEAAEVFLDPFRVVGNASANHETREFALGYSIAERLLLVVYLERTKNCRIRSTAVSNTAGG